jgi:hypothetical protein
MNKVLGKPLALGRTAEIFAWEEGKVIKLFFDWFELGDIQFEQKLNTNIHASGLPVPAPGEIIRVNGRNGLIYTRIDGLNMWETLGQQPLRLMEFARRTAKLQAEMHANPTRPNIPSQRYRLENKLKHAEILPQTLKDSALVQLAQLPDGESICHGDFHPGNILITGKRAVIIDWIDASIGNPLADVARSSIIALGAAGSPKVVNPLLRLLLYLFHHVYIHQYFSLRPGGKQEYKRWLPLVAAARLSENIHEQEKWLLKRALRGLTSLT